LPDQKVRTTEDQHIKSQITIEKQQRQARNAKSMNHKLMYLGTSRIIAPDLTGTWVEFTSKEDIEAGCQWENSRRFSQTSSTPFMTSPLFEEFRYLTQGPATSEVLSSTYIPPPKTEIYARKLFQELRMDPAIEAAPPMNVVFSMGQHTKGWRKV
jgi:hypothetical protein